MHQAIRVILAFAVLHAAILPAPAKPPEKKSEYKQDDKSFYLKSDVLKAEPRAVILPESSMHHIGDSFFLPGRPHPAKEIYLQRVSDWVEPITPPSMPANLNIPLDVMQVREPQGDVQVALPSAPANFNAVTDGMALPNGSVLKTGGSGTVAVLFGGVDSVRLAPNSQAAVQLTVQAAARDAEVDLHEGVAFSKVGQLIGEKESYQVHTPSGIASAHGTDFATVALADRIDVWVAQGTVQLTSPEGKKVASLMSNGKGPLKVMRYPVAKDAQAAMTESSETLTSALEFIPMVNQKLKALADRTQGGAKLTPTETAYLGRIRRVPALIRLTLVPPPAPPPAPVLVKPMPVVAPVVPPPPETALQPVVSAPTTAVDPNSLAPGKTSSPSGNGSSTAAESGGAPQVRQRKVSLDLRDQDNSPSDKPGKPVAAGPKDTIP